MIKYIKYLVPVIIGVITPVIFYYFNIDYIMQDGNPVPIEGVVEDYLIKNENNYVEFYGVCAGDVTYYEEIKGRKIEVYSILECGEPVIDSVLVFAKYSNRSKYPGINISDDNLNFWSGRLVKGLDVSSTLLNMIKREGVNFSYENVWTLEVGNLPSMDKNIMNNLKTICPIFAFLLFLLFLINDVKAARDKKRMDEEQNRLE